jgi:hypothetical protein
VEVDFGIEALAGDTFEGFVESPVAAAEEDAYAVDGDGQVIGVGDGVGDFSDAEVECLLVRRLSYYLGSEVESVEVLWAVAVGPP